MPPFRFTPASPLHLFTACPDCDLLLPKQIPGRGKKIICPRCGKGLLYHSSNTVNRSLALSLTGLILYIPAMFMPLLTFSMFSMSETGNVIQTISSFLDKEYYPVAIIVFISTLLFPLLKLSLLAFVSLSLKWNYFPKKLDLLFRAFCVLEEWAMVEIYLLGIMITIIKMYDSTDITFGIGFYCFSGLVLLSVISSLTVCKETYWNLIETRGKTLLHKHPSPDSLSLEGDSITALANKIIVCGTCNKLFHQNAIPPDSTSRCIRCNSRLYPRIPKSITTTWALLLSALILIFPANLLPMMHVEFMGIPTQSTILDGIRTFFQDGSYIIALIILTASILIPIFKIVGLSIALFSIHFNRAHFLKQKTQMYRFIEFIGRWSMLDIFVIALLGYYINFGFLTSIKTAPAATFFCLTVVATMTAAITFDPRLLWDNHTLPLKSNNTTNR